MLDLKKSSLSSSLSSSLQTVWYGMMWLDLVRWPCQHYAKTSRQFKTGLHDIRILYKEKESEKDSI